MGENNINETTNHNGGAFRKKKVYFTQVSNNLTRDNKVSLKAKGLYALIQSYITIEKFILYKNNLKKDCSEGEVAFESAWSELKKKGYLIQYRLKNSKGIFYYEYDLLDSKNICKSVESQENAHSIHTPVFGGVDNIPHGKQGVYNNTDLNKIDKIPLSKKEEEETPPPSHEGNGKLIKGKTKVGNEKYIFYSKYKSADKVITAGEKYKLDRLVEKYSLEIVSKAIEVNFDHNTAISFSYIETVLEDWTNKGIITLEEIEEHLAKHKAVCYKAKEKRNKVTENISEGHNYNEQMENAKRGIEATMDELARIGQMN